MQYSIVNYQSVVDSSHSMRLDAEFFHLGLSEDPTPTRGNQFA